MRLWQWYLGQLRYPRRKIDFVRRARTRSLVVSAGWLALAVVGVVSGLPSWLWIAWFILSGAELARGFLADLELWRRERGNYPPSDPDGRMLQGEERLAHLNS